MPNPPEPTEVTDRNTVHLQHSPLVYIGNASPLSLLILFDIWVCNLLGVCNQAVLLLSSYIRKTQAGLELQSKCCVCTFNAVHRHSSALAKQLMLALTFSNSLSCERSDIAPFSLQYKRLETVHMSTCSTSMQTRCYCKSV